MNKCIQSLLLEFLDSTTQRELNRHAFAMKAHQPNLRKVFRTVKLVHQIRGRATTLNLLWEGVTAEFS